MYILFKWEIQCLNERGTEKMRKWERKRDVDCVNDRETEKMRQWERGRGRVKMRKWKWERERENVWEIGREKMRKWDGEPFVRRVPSTLMRASKRPSTKKTVLLKQSKEREMVSTRSNKYWETKMWLRQFYEEIFILKVDSKVILF
jgi:hypothetical protein